MKITIEKIPVNSEPEIVIRSNELNEPLLQIINFVKNISHKKLTGIYDAQIHIIEPSEVYYFESVDNKVFIYCEEKVFESKLKLYEIESEYQNSHFFRASKSTILNFEKIQAVSPAFNGRFEALLQNGEKVIISRQFVPELRKKIGL